MNRRKCFALFAAATICFAACSMVANAGGAIFGYVAEADVAVPGGKIQTWSISGVLIASDANAATVGARNEATARMSAKGNVLVGPTITLCSPFVGRQERVIKER